MPVNNRNMERYGYLANVSVHPYFWARHIMYQIWGRYRQTYSRIAKRGASSNLKWKTADWFTNSWWAKEEEYKRMLFIIPAILLPSDGYRKTMEKERTLGVLFPLFAFVNIALLWKLTWYTRNYNKGPSVDDKKWVRRNFGRKQREPKELEPDERSPESYPHCLSSPLLSGDISQR